MPDNRQVLYNIEAYTRDRLHITQSLNHRLGLRKSSLPGAQPVTVAMVQSDQLTANIPNHLPNSIATGQQDDFDYQDNREEELYQVDGTTDVQTPTDNSDDNEDNEPENNAHKRQRKTYAPADTVGKEMTKQRQAEVPKKQQEKERAKAQTEASKDKPDNANRPHKSKAKASHPDQIKSSKRGRRTARTCNDNRLPNDIKSDEDTQDEGVLIGDEDIDEDILSDDGEEPLGPDKIGFYTFFLKEQGNPPDLMGIEDDQLLAIQNDLQGRLKARDKARERAVSRKLHELEKKQEFANAQFLKHFTQVSELLKHMVKDGQAKVKLTDKMLMIPALFDGENPEKSKMHYKRFN